MTFNCGMINPDGSNPFLVYRPTTFSTSGVSSIATNASVLFFNFNLPTTTIGLGYKQLIGVQFPPELKTQLLLTSGGTQDLASTKYSCALFDYSLSLTAPTKFIVTGVVGFLGDDVTFWCRIDDLVNTLTSGKSYGLQITLLVGTILTPISTARQISMFTTSGSSMYDRIIIDYNPCFAEMALYNDFTPVSTTAPFGIVSTSAINTYTILQTPATISFDVIANATPISFRPIDTVIVVTWPSLYLTAGTLSITSSDIVGATLPINKMYTPSTTGVNLGITIIGTNTAIISGIVDDLVATRSFKLNILGFTATNIITTGANIELFVYYKNSYSVIAYTYRPLIVVQKLLFSSFNVTPTDGWSDIKQGGAWNVNFSFTLTGGYNFPGYIVIKHTGLTATNKVNFLASTCDFSAMTAVPSLILGARSICYPLNMNYSYPIITGSVTGTLEGSGIAFYVKTLPAVVQSLNVFLFSELCVPSIINTTDSMYNLSLPMTGSYAFKVSLFKNVDLTKTNENRFITANNEIAVLPNTLNLPCTGYISYLNSNTYGIFNSNVYTNYTTGKSAFLFREISDFALPLMTVVTSSGATCALCFFKDMSLTANNLLTYGFLTPSSSILSAYTTIQTSNQLGAGTATNYVAVLGEIGSNSVSASGTVVTYSFCNFLACARTGTIGPLPNFKMEMSVANASKFFTLSSLTDGLNTCYYSWGMAVHNDLSTDTSTTPAGAATNNFTGANSGSLSNNSTSQSKLLSTTAATAAALPSIMSTATTPVALLNIISADTSTPTTYKMNPSPGPASGNTFLSTGLFMSFTSTNFNDASIAAFPALAQGNMTTVVLNYSFHFAVYNTCIKWSSAITITSTFNYVDIQLNVREATSSAFTSSYVSKVNRFFKFVTDSYVLSHYASKASVSEVVTFHTVNYNAIAVLPASSPTATQVMPTFSYNGVCMLQINNEAISTAGTFATTTNILVIYLSNLMLIEMDISDVTSTYPINSATITAYAFNSLPFWVGSVDSSTPSTANNLSYPWYKDYLSWGPVSASTNLTHNTQIGVPPAYIKLPASNIKDGFVLLVSDWGPRSTSKSFLGSSLWLKFSTALGVTAPDIFFPTYCPNTSTETTASPNKILSYRPLVQLNYFGQSTTAGSFFPLTFDIIYSAMSTSTGQGCVLSSINSLTNVCSASYFIMDSAKSAVGAYDSASGGTNTAMATNVFVAVRWQAYSIATTTNYLTLTIRQAVGAYSNSFPTIPGAATTTTTTQPSCTATSLFLSNNMVFDNITPSISLYLNGGAAIPQYIWYNSGSTSLVKNIYLFGKRFNKVAFSTISTLQALSPGSNYYTGLVRPAVDAFTFITSTGSSLLYPSDNIAFFCTAKGFAQESMFNSNNYINITPTLTDGYFVVDWFASSISAFSATGTSLLGMQTLQIAMDTPSLYVNDLASMIKISMKFGTSIGIPANNQSSFQLSLTSYGANSRCAMQYTNSALNAEECSFLNGIFTCPLFGLTTEVGINPIIICCIGINLTGELVFPVAASGNNSLSVNFNSNAPLPVGSTLTSNYNTISVYNFTGFPTTTAPVVLANLYASAAIAMTSTTLLPKISMSYSLISQEGSLTKVTFMVTLGREAVRNSQIVISGGDLSGFQATNLTPRCYATFSIPVTSGTINPDLFIDRCSTSLLASSGNITVTLGNRVNRCGTLLPKIIYINLLGVVGLATTTVNTYTVAMNFPIGTTTNILQTGFTTVLTNSLPGFTQTPLLPVPLALRNLNNLCNVSSISPAIVGELGDFTFAFDFSIYSNPSSKPLNEVLIIFPIATFSVNAGTFSSPVACYFGVVPTQVACRTLEDNFLIISVPTATLATQQIVTVVGVSVPTTTTNIIFNCSTNFVDPILGRTVYATGYGTYTAASGIVDPTGTGLLKIISVAAGSVEPRTSNTLSFTFGFELATLAAQTLPASITGGFLIVTLPFPDFNLNWYMVNSVTASMTENNNVTTSSVTTLTSTTVNLGAVIARSNKIYIPFSDATRTINSSTYVNWQLVLSGVPLPNDAITTGGRFKVTLSNTPFTALYRGYVNLSTVSVLPILTPAVDNITGYNTNNLITYARGLTFSYSSLKYVIDVTGCGTLGTAGNKSNYIYLKAGRSNTCQFTIRVPSIVNNKLPQTSVMIGLTSTIIKLSTASVTLFPTAGSASFMIGVPCGTSGGTYYATFSVSDAVNYYNLQPIIVFVDSAAAISTFALSPSAIPDTAQGGFQPINFASTDYAVDTLSYTFVGDLKTVTATQDAASAVVTAVTLGTAVNTIVIAPFTNTIAAFFQTPNATAIGAQKFTGTSSNACFNPTLLAVFGVAATQQVLTTITNFASYFTAYKNADTTGSTLLKNQLQFTFTPAAGVFPLNLSCVLYCFASTISDNMLRSGLSGFTTSPLLQTYSAYIGNISPVNILFSGLVRGNKYSLKCLASSTQIIVTSRTYVTYTFATWDQANPSDIKTSNPLPPSCAAFTSLNADFDASTKTLMINYCQRYFTALQNPTTPNPACIVCTDMNKMTAPGVAFSNNTLCMATPAYNTTKLRFLSGSNSYSRFLQNSTNTTNTTPAAAPVIFTYNVCPIQDLVCSADLVSTKLVSDLLNSFILSLNSAANFLSVLGKTVPFNAVATVITDTTVPNVNITSTLPVYISATGQWSVTLSNSPSLFCYWALTASTGAQTNTSIQTCVSTPAAPCGASQVTVAGTVITSNPVNTVNPFQYNTNYFLWVYCSNNIPNSAQFAPAAKVYTLPTGASPVSPASNNTASNSTANNTTPISNTTAAKNNSSYGSFLSYGIAIMISLLLLI